MRRVLASIALCFLCFGACRTYDVTYTDTPTCDPDSGSGSTTCNDVPCIDLTTDRTNCGACGTLCAPNETCQASQCTPCAAATPTACPTSCPGGSNCISFCTDISSDNNNCGGCSIECSQGLSCKDGTCGCPLTTCGNECVDTQNDISHCGGCDTPCAGAGPGEISICSKGQCAVECVSPLADCDGIGSNGCEANLQTDDDNCAACGRVCANGGTCKSGACPVVAYATGTFLAGLAVDANFVYLVDQSSPGIEKVPITGGSPTPFIVDAQATALAVDSNVLAWLHVNTEIQSEPVGGGATTLLTTTSGIQTLTAAGGFAYFSTTTAIERVPLDGSSQAVTITTASDAQSLAVDATNIYFADLVGDVRYAPIGQQDGASTLFTSLDAVAMTADATTIYWIDNNGAVVSTPKSNSSQQTKLSTNESIAPGSNLVTDGTAIYWADGETPSSIHRLPVSGGTSKILASQQQNVRVLALDATNIYWSSPTIVAATTK